MTREQYEKLKELLHELHEACTAPGLKKIEHCIKADKLEKELDKLMGFDSTHPMEPNRYKD